MKVLGHARAASEFLALCRREKSSRLVSLVREEEKKLRKK